MFKKAMSKVYMFLQTPFLALHILWDITMLYLFGNSIKKNYVKQCKPEIKIAVWAVLRYFMGLLLIAAVIKFI